VTRHATARTRYSIAPIPYHRWQPDWPPSPTRCSRPRKSVARKLVTLTTLRYGRPTGPMTPHDPLSADYEKAQVRATMWLDANEPRRRVSGRPRYARQTSSVPVRESYLGVSSWSSSGEFSIQTSTHRQLELHEDVAPPCHCGQDEAILGVAPAQCRQSGYVRRPLTHRTIVATKRQESPGPTLGCAFGLFNTDIRDCPRRCTSSRSVHHRDSATRTNLRSRADSLGRILKSCHAFYSKD